MTEPVNRLISRLKKEIAEPIFYTESLQLPVGVKDVLPSKMPPLRRDAPTLVLGKLPAGLKTMEVKLSGKVAGKEISDSKTFKVPAADIEHFFLVGIYDQWKSRKDQPAAHHKPTAFAGLCLQAEPDRRRGRCCSPGARWPWSTISSTSLANCSSRPSSFLRESPRAKGGLNLVDHMKTGRKNRKQMLTELRMDAAKPRSPSHREGQRPGDRSRWRWRRQGRARGAGKPDPLDDFKQRREISRQQATARVTEAVRQANRLVRLRPDDAKELLKQELDDVKNNTDIDPAVRTSRVSRRTDTLQSVERQGAIVQAERERSAMACGSGRCSLSDLCKSDRAGPEQVRERMRVFHNLMDQAREEEAYRQALAIRNDLIDLGQPVPQAVSSGYQTALSGYHLREIAGKCALLRGAVPGGAARGGAVARALPRRAPPVEFPSDTVVRRNDSRRFRNWKEFSKWRIKEYSISTFGSDVPGRDVRDARSNKTVEYKLEAKATLVDVLSQLGRVHSLTFDINERAFKREGVMDVKATEIARSRGESDPPMKATLSTILKKIPSVEHRGDFRCDLRHPPGCGRDHDRAGRRRRRRSGPIRWRIWSSSRPAALQPAISGSASHHPRHSRAGRHHWFAGWHPAWGQAVYSLVLARPARRLAGWQSGGCLVVR